LFSSVRLSAETNKHEGTDLDEAPDALVHARAPAPPPPAPATRRGRPSVYDWERIEALDDTFCRTYFAKNKRAPTWKQRHAALVQKLGDDNTPDIETSKRELRPR
jgi:hypothetical protein